MKILLLTWKDLKNPLAGGAEVFNEELAARLVKDGHEVRLVAAGFEGASASEMVNGYEVIRVGKRWTVYWEAYKYYKQHLRGWADLVIDEINTIPFFAKLYVQEPNVVLFHQLCREIWFYQMFFPLNLIGYFLEPLYLRLLNDRIVLTVSNSTKKDLLRLGYKKQNIHILSEGIELSPVKDIQEIKKYDQPTLLSLGALREMKRSDHLVEAFESAKQSMPDLQMKIAGDGSGPYGQRVLARVAKSPYAADIEYLGRVSKEKKIELMQRSHVIGVTSVKEGWGLIVTEANSQGTPAVVYNVDGLRDSVKDGETGLVTSSNTPQKLGEAIVALLSDAEQYEVLRRQAWDWSRTITFDQTKEDFILAVEKVIRRPARKP